MSISEWVTGDMLGLPIPAHSEALHEGRRAIPDRSFPRMRRAVCSKTR